MNQIIRQVKSVGARTLHAEDGRQKKANSHEENYARKAKTNIGVIAIKSFVLHLMLGTAYRVMTQDAATPYPKMASIEKYLMERTAEIALARSAALESNSRDTEVRVLGRHGFETAVKGKNGFVCEMEAVERPATAGRLTPGLPGRGRLTPLIRL